MHPRLPLLRKSRSPLESNRRRGHGRSDRVGGEGQNGGKGGGSPFLGHY